jgi:general secretion pathway protein C
VWKKYLWVKNLVFLCFVSYLLAKIGNTLLLAAMKPSEPYPNQNAATREVEQKPAGKEPLDHYRSISQRNVFNSDHKGEDGGNPGQTAARSNAPLQKSDLSVQLIGTVVGSSKNSFAVVEDPQTRQQELFRVDDTIQDQARVVAISRCTVVLRRGGIEEILECPEPGSSRSTKSTAAPPPVAEAPPPAKREPGEIRKLSESEYVIDRAEVENALGDYNQIMTQVNIGPNIEDGKPDGLRLFHVKPDSFWAKAGMKTGDVIRRVNDLELSTVDNALKAFDTMRKEKEVLMEISRAGASQSIHWEIE